MIKLIKESNDDYSYNLEYDLYNYVDYPVSRLVHRLEKDGFYETDVRDYEDGSRDCVWTDDKTATVNIYLDDRWHVRNVVVTSIVNESIRKRRKNGEVLKESDDKITARTFQELISKLEDHGYSCEHYYDMKYPESNWLYITKNGDPYEAEFYRYSDGEYELYLHNIHPTKEKNEDCYNMKSRKDAKNMKFMKESYSDIDVTNVWDAYYIAKDYLGADTLCDNLATSMDSLTLSDQLKDIFRLFEIPFMEDDEFDEEDYDLDIDEGCHRRKTKKNSRKLKEDSSKRYGRYLVKIARYKNMNKLDYIDELWDKSDYCLFDENGYLDTDYSGISRDLFDKIYDPSMKPGHVYEVYTDGPYGDIIGFKEVPYGWFRY